MNKQDIYEFLDQKGIPYECTEHIAIYTVEEAESVFIPHSECNAKNLFLRDDKKRNFYLFTLPYHRSVSIKELRGIIGARPLRFASEEELWDILRLKKGSVTPLGLLNDEERKVKFYLDGYFRDGYMNIHPNENTATIHIATHHLTRLLAEHGTETEYLELENSNE
ncbi:MAG: prolyl-tRNA synthetase associated domain-containing protein [Oscillospiraceae bacterium]|nr:prolyl-tRNA synthetase associated domain-containing protein [Oscillospiraceae bacterium]